MALRSACSDVLYIALLWQVRWVGLGFWVEHGIKLMLSPQFGLWRHKIQATGLAVMCLFLVNMAYP